LVQKTSKDENKSTENLFPHNHKKWFLGVLGCLTYCRLSLDVDGDKNVDLHGSTALFLDLGFFLNQRFDLDLG